MVKSGNMEYTSFVEAGVSIPSPVELHLLPLLQSEKKVQPPLQRLPKEVFKSNRVAFHVGSTSWISSNHVFPAAFPRSHFHATHQPGPAPIEIHPEILQGGKEVERQFRQRDIQQFEEQLSHCSPESMYPPHSKQEADRIAQTLAESGQPQLWGCVERIIPTNQKPKGKHAIPITLFLSHANGFHKEIYEPMLESLLNELEGSDVIVEEIWSLDTFNSGHAGILNRDTLSVCTPWWDHARDIQQFLQSYLPPRSQPVNVQLNRQNDQAGRKDRTIIAITHSHSGAAGLMLFCGPSNLCDGHITIDPMVTRFEDFSIAAIPTGHPLFKGAIVRKDLFKNKKEVIDYMESKPYFQAWDHRVRENHIRFGFHPVKGSNEENKDPPITLCMTKWSEASQFASSWCGAWGALELTRPKTKSFTNIIWTKYSRSISQLQRAREQVATNFAKFGDRFSWSDWNVNHLAVQENPDLSAREIAKIIKQRLSSNGPKDSARL